ncbi:FMN-binding protein [Konateibacter massiliensis]|uniref:FMN-binding protein n=1 Tax=Konateibacter massiliensis TaxID=2002841 RepID=UPI000C15376B|nr:FMN-binding protein [Konateibacter massiliensis]
MKEPNKAGRDNLRKVILIIGIVLFVLFSIFAAIVLTQKPTDLQVSNVDIDTINDGVYVGSADNGLVRATVSVEVNNGKVLSVTILEHEQLLGKKAEKITDSIIAQQSLEVDAVTSATYSSDTIRKAIENALRQGE